MCSAAEARTFFHQIDAHEMLPFEDESFDALSRTMPCAVFSIEACVESVVARFKV